MGRRADQKAPRCTERDNLYEQRCEVRGEHDVIVNSKGQQSLAHHNENAVWSTPISGLTVVKALPPDPMAIGAMLDRARHATPEDVAAGGANNEEELLMCLRHGYERGVQGDDRGKNDFGFVVWPNGVRAFEAGWAYAKGENAAALIQEARK